MEEIKLYYDIERTREITSEVEFEKVEAGQKSQREIYIFNDINFKVNVELILEGKNIKLTETIKELIPKQSKKVVFELDPKLTTMKPITAKLKIKLDYVVR